MKTLQAKIESILFVTARPMTVKKLADACDVKQPAVIEAVEALATLYDSEERGVRVLNQDGQVQMATSPETADLVQKFIKDETTGELTKPSLEALTVIAYRGPISKAELEQIRGVNCSIILRNLMMRGLISVKGEPGLPISEYTVTVDFVRFLGISKLEDLPNYDELRSHENIVGVLEQEDKKRLEDLEKAATKNADSEKVAEVAGEESATEEAVQE